MTEKNSEFDLDQPVPLLNGMKTKQEEEKDQIQQLNSLKV